MLNTWKDEKKLRHSPSIVERKNKRKVSKCAFSIVYDFFFLHREDIELFLNVREIGWFFRLIGFSGGRVWVR